VSIGEEPDEGKPHVRFCEGHSKSIATANAGDKVRLDMSTRQYKILNNRIPARPDLYGLSTQEQYIMLPLVVTQGIIFMKTIRIVKYF